MALRSALVDRARWVRNATTGGGSSSIHGAWFKARLDAAPVADPQDAPGARSWSRPQPVLLYGTLDEQGEPVEVSPRDRVEVESAELGTAVYRAANDPTPLRKKRTVIGYQLTLGRVAVAEATDDGYT